MTSRRRACLALLLLLPLAWAACGRRGPPIPPERRLPGAVQDLAGVVVGEGVRLTWSLPRTRVDQSPLKELSRAEVYRRVEAPGRAEPPRPAVVSFGGLFGGPSTVVGFERVASIELATPEAQPGAQAGARPGPAPIAGRRLTYTDTQGLAIGQRYTYVVVAVDEQGRLSPPSNRVAIAVAAPLRPPVGLTARPGDGEVRLTWGAPPALVDGSPIPGPVLYNVFRAAAPDARPERPVNPEPLDRLDFVDLGLQNETTYYYSVQALLGDRGALSQPTAAVAVTPEDRTPPAQPRGLVAVVAGTTVRLAWGAVADPDLAGYHVYRSTTPGRGYTKLTPAPHTASTYVDEAVPRGQTYYYVVTAVDRARRANESVPSPEASTRVP